ncbi:hypothetical protein [Micromonospora parva]
MKLRRTYIDRLVFFLFGLLMLAGAALASYLGHADPSFTFRVSRT